MEGWDPKVWDPEGGPREDDKAAREAVEKTRETLRSPDVAYTGDLPLGETWALTFGHSRDSEILEESNWDVVTGDLSKRFPKDTEVVEFGHFAVGWIEEFAVRMLDKKGHATAAARAALKWAKKLEDYPVADEEDVSRREFEATIENIRSEGSLSEEEAQKVYDWLWNHNQRALDHRDSSGAAYPSRDDIDEALEDLGLREPEVEEEEIVVEEPPYQDPNQGWFWPEARP